MRACLGHVAAGLELAEQVARGEMPTPDYLFVPLGSMGTAAGLLVGCRLAGLRCRLVGVATYSRWFCTAGRWAATARRVLRFMRRRDPTVPNIDIHRHDVDVVTTALGRGYAHETEAAQRVGREMAELEGLATDGTYTAKTLVGMLDYARISRAEKAASVYWHTYQPRNVTD